MPIYTLRNKKSTTYRVFIEGDDGQITKTFKTRADAKRFETEMLHQKQTGVKFSVEVNRLTVNEFFASSFEEAHIKSSDGWKTTKLQMYRDYVGPVIGKMKLNAVKGFHINKVLRKMKDEDLGPQMQVHVFNLLGKLFRDAVEDYEYLSYSPVKRKYRPVLPKTETPHLKVDEAKKLLQYVRGKPFEVAIWIEGYTGMRVGEIQALTWEDVDLEEGRIYIRKTFVRKEKRLRPYPKEKKWRSSKLPPELLELLIERRKEASSEFVATSPTLEGMMMSYDSYLKAVQRYCREIGITEVATHGLRHTFSAVFKQHGGNTELLQRHHNHSTQRVTEGYVHDDHSEVDDVMGKILLFPEKSTGTDALG